MQHPPAEVQPESDAVGAESPAMDTAAADVTATGAIATGTVAVEAAANDPSQPSGVLTRQQPDGSSSVQTAQTSIDGAKTEEKVDEKMEDKKAEQVREANPGALTSPLANDCQLASDGFLSLLMWSNRKPSPGPISCRRE